MMGKVYIVGAGPGDPELITVKGLKILQKADVVVYDRLVSKELLNNCKDGAELVYVGKELGQASLQEEINKLLVNKAKEGKIVVRLKGGDPYVFGRGEEECKYVIENGLECEVVPGISSATGVPIYAGIPVTTRWASSGFTVITGTRADDKLIDEDYIPKKGTIVILMGLHIISELKQILLKKRGPEEPVAIIENGTLPSQRVVTGRLKDIDLLVKENDIKSPAVIVVGEVVKYRDILWKYA
ncbi:MAG: uroporphyrinogen-III C-methyltransferase [Sulfolobaceae archaeon]|nr:uroporphyrinogen-III C-methyltransferase [Sulfolobaceae archaeon]